MSLRLKSTVVIDFVYLTFNWTFQFDVLLRMDGVLTTGDGVIDEIA